MEWKLLLQLLLVIVYSQHTYQSYQSKLFKNAEQVQFASSLKEYHITKPKFSLSKIVRLQRLSLATIKDLKPEIFYVKIKFNSISMKLELKRNKHLIGKHYQLENDYIKNKDQESMLRQSYKSAEGCYYSGHVLYRYSSRVAVSICEGLKGFINYDGRSYLIEPMKRAGRSYLHLVYESKNELNSTHNPMKGANLQCHTGEQKEGFSKDVSSSDINDMFFSSSKTTSPIVEDIKTETRVTRRQRRDLTNYVDVLPIATVEVMIVVDKFMTSFHGNVSIQDYVLTMMNMVSDMYKDPSLGVVIDIVVTKIMVLDKDQEHLKISHNGDRTLFSFCEWQFLKTLSGNNAEPDTPYDIALLLTRLDVCAHSDQPCGTIGLAYIGGTCTTNRKCAVVEDIGLNTAYTIAHEIGHNLGMTHDGLDNDCKMESNGFPHMMAAQWPISSHIPLKWSYCSKKKLGDFLGSYKSYCIREERLEDSPPAYVLANDFPGQHYDADTQCKQQYGGVAKHCTHFKISGQPTDMCKKLWCEVEGEEKCVSKSDPAAKGTACDKDKWCMYGKCVNNTNIPDRVRGGWSPYENWTKCSRSCGVGVQYKERLCNNPLPRNGGSYCIGENRLYRTCNTQDCPVSSEDIRLLQCKQYNNKTHKYIPVHSELQPCALHCRPSNYSAHYSIKFQEKVIDGTLCKHTASNICINGHCETIGCDKQLNSKLQKDICGVCGGNGDTCNLVEGEFTQPLGRGYVKAVEIPQGAQNVLVQEVKPCASFLALKSGPGTYHVNGNWTIELPGKYDVNGTVVYYRRRGTQEFFFMEGPTKSKMYFMVLFQDFNFGVKWRYVLPLNRTVNSLSSETKKYKGSFGWMQGPWNECSVVCGGGIITRSKPRCLHMYLTNISIVDDQMCSGAKMPAPEEKTCNEQKCLKVWFVTPWTSCSATCGLGRMKRIVSCKAQKPDGKFEERDPYECSLAEKPVSINTCVEKACYLSWKRSPWSVCRANCGQFGMKYRKVSCPLHGACLDSLKPVTMHKCKATKCDYQFIPEPWKECSKTCGIGEQTRTLICREVNSFVASPGKCTWRNIPRTIRTCKLKGCNVTMTTTPITTTTELPQTTEETIINVYDVTFSTNKTTVNSNVNRRRIKRKPGLLYPENLLYLLKSKEATHQKADICIQQKRWYCDIKLQIRRIANIPFCELTHVQKRCCKTCKEYLNGEKLPLRRRRKLKR